MEFCGDQSTLNRISRESSGLPEKIVRDYTKSLLKAVECLHENNIMHRDIKGANIFLKPVDAYHPEKTILKLGDFGCSIKFKDPVDPSNKERATGFMGTFGITLLLAYSLHTSYFTNSTIIFFKRLWHLK